MHWLGHNDAVTSLCCPKQYPILLSTCLDCSVRMWAVEAMEVSH